MFSESLSSSALSWLLEPVKWTIPIVVPGPVQRGWRDTQKSEGARPLPLCPSLEGPRLATAWPTGSGHSMDSALRWGTLCLPLAGVCLFSPLCVQFRATWGQGFALRRGKPVTVTQWPRTEASRALSIDGASVGEAG